MAVKSVVAALLLANAAVDGARISTIAQPSARHLTWETIKPTPTPLCRESATSIIQVWQGRTVKVTPIRP